MAIDVAAGYPNYEADGINKNIPWLYSRRVVTKWYDKSVMPYMSNKDYDGEIEGAGDKVVIRTVPTVVIDTTYKKGGTVNWQNMASPAVELTVNRTAVYALRFDKIDIKQFDIDMQSKSVEDGSEQMRITIDEQFLGDVYADAHADNKGTSAGKSGPGYNLGTTGSAFPLTKVNIIEKIMECEAVMDEQSAPTEGRFLTLPTWAKLLLNISDLKNASFSGQQKSFLINKGGYITSLGRFDIFESNRYTAVADAGNSAYNITFGHTDAIASAAQLTEMEYHEKFENTFGSGMKALQVYDWKVIKPEALGVLYAYKG